MSEESIQPDLFNTRQEYIVVATNVLAHLKDQLPVVLKTKKSRL